MLDEQFDSGSEESYGGAGEQSRVLNILATSEDPRTISQIKRSRIDLARRYVFLCPMSLSKQFEVLPQQAKDSALLVFRCRRNLLFPDSFEVRKSRTDSRLDCGVTRIGKRPPASASASLSKGTLSSAIYQSEFSREFMQWVLIKEKEGCVFWYKPEKDLRKLSTFIEDKIDPVNEMPYRPLLLDPQWWRVKFVRTNGKYLVNPSLVVNHLPRGDANDQSDIDIMALQELIYQSNPTLEPISKWPHAPSMRFLPRPLDAANQDYVGQDTRFKGYIDQELPPNGSPMSISLKEHSRISCWPESIQRDRRDNLHHRWQLEEACSARRLNLATHGASTLSGALSAR